MRRKTKLKAPAVVFAYDLDYRPPPPPRPVTLPPPVGEEPLRKTIPMVIDQLDECVTKTSRIFLRVRLVTQDGDHYIVDNVFTDRPELLWRGNEYVVAVGDAAGRDAGQLILDEIQHWVGKTISVDLKFERGTYSRWSVWGVGPVTT